MHPRMKREQLTIKKMIGIFCRHHHSPAPDHLCPQCSKLLNYAILRLKHCPFQEAKTSCANCKVHCYKPKMRDKIREVMRFAGPRMTLRHPVLALWHLLDGRRQKPASRK